MLPASLLLPLALSALSSSLASIQGLNPTSPGKNASTVLAVGNSGSSSIYTNEDGSVNQEYLRNEMRYVAGKYSRWLSEEIPVGRRSKRAHLKKEKGRDGQAVEGQTGEAALTNEATIEYDATVGMGTPSQPIIFNMDTGAFFVPLAFDGRLFAIRLQVRLIFGSGLK